MEISYGCPYENNVLELLAAHNSKRWKSRNNEHEKNKACWSVKLLTSLKTYGFPPRTFLIGNHAL